jgi:hypothetical protein
MAPYLKVIFFSLQNNQYQSQLYVSEKNEVPTILDNHKVTVQQSTGKQSNNLR